MEWHREGVHTFQSAIKPFGARLADWATVEGNIHYLSQERTQIRTILNEGMNYGQRDRVITIDGIKQRRPPRYFPTLYQLAAKAYAGYQEDEEFERKPTTGYKTCFEYLMSGQPAYEPELILHVRHTQKWVVDCTKPGEATYQEYSPYEYRVAYVKPNVWRETVPMQNPPETDTRDTDNTEPEDDTEETQGLTIVPIQKLKQRSIYLIMLKPANEY